MLLTEHITWEGALNIGELIETTAQISRSSPRLIATRPRIPDSILHNYWRQSRKILNRWNQLLQQHSQGNNPILPDQTAEIGTYLDAIFAANLLHRVWCTILLVIDQHHPQGQAAGIARSVMTAQMQTNHSALTLMVNASPAELESLAPQDRFRRKCERWTDFLLGHLVLDYGFTDFACHAERARDFGLDQFAEDRDPVQASVWELLSAGLRTAFPKDSRCEPDLAEDFQTLVQSVLIAFPPGTLVTMVSADQTPSERLALLLRRIPTDSPLPPLRPPVQQEILRKSAFRNRQN